MKKTILMLFVCISAISGYSQTDSKKILETLYSFTDQYGSKFSSSSITDSLVIIYISGLERNSITMGYDKLKEKKLVKPQQVVLVGGFNNMQGEASAKISHLKMGFTSMYGNDYPKVLLDADAKIGELLPATGLALIIIKKDSNKVGFIDYGTKRKIFFDAISKYFN